MELKPEAAVHEHAKAGKKVGDVARAQQQGAHAANKRSSHAARSAVDSATKRSKKAQPTPQPGRKTTATKTKDVVPARVADKFVKEAARFNLQGAHQNQAGRPGVIESSKPTHAVLHAMQASGNKVSPAAVAWAEGLGRLKPSAGPSAAERLAMLRARISARASSASPSPSVRSTCESSCLGEAPPADPGPPARDECGSTGEVPQEGTAETGPAAAPAPDPAAQARLAAAQAAVVKAAQARLAASRTRVETREGHIAASGG